MKFPEEYIILGMKELNKESFKPVKNGINPNKPIGGIWASPYSTNNEYVSEWHKWCSSEMEEWLSNDAIILKLKNDAKIYTINTQDDLIELISIVGEPHTKFLKFQCIPDFENAAKLFDVLYLTEDGQYNTRMPDIKMEYNLYGWDCESIMILNFDCISEWRYEKLNIL